MIKELIFLWKYQILKDPQNLANYPEKFFKLSKKSQQNILNKYFNKFKNISNIDIIFDTNKSSYYDGNMEITFFNSYYFDKLLIKHNPISIRLIDKFTIEKSKKDHLIDYTLDYLKENNLIIKSQDLIHYPDNLPKTLSTSLEFMTYLVKEDESNIKYIIYSEEYITKQRELIKQGIETSKKKEFKLKKFLKNNGELPKTLKNNLDFQLYLIENNIENINYLEDNILDNITISNQRILIDTIIKSLQNDPSYLSILEKNLSLADILNRDEQFLKYLITLNINNISYVDFHHLTNEKRNNIINFFTTILDQKEENFNIMKFPSRELFFQNQKFMNHLIEEDFRWIATIKVDDREETNQLIDKFFTILNKTKYKFHLQDFLEDGKYLNYRLIENDKMIHYFFSNKVPVVQYINFFDTTSPKLVVENILKEIEKKDYEFHNDDFLINGKYPIPLSNNYRFMRYVIDKNFNHLSYIDISMIDNHELKRIINYAFKMVYYIRGNNRNLNFDIEGYFKDTDIYKNEYFQECLESISN